MASGSRLELSSQGSVRSPWMAGLADVLADLASAGATAPADPRSPMHTPGQGETVPAHLTAESLQALNRVAHARRVFSGGERPLRFVDASQFGGLSAMAYESEIASTGRVPTRCAGDGVWHDWCNALAWLAWPNIKCALNGVQVRAMRTHAHASCGRGRRRDALTLLDESGLILVTDDPSIRNDLRTRRWRDLFVARRAAFEQRAAVWMVGHGLMEKLRRPFKSACGQVQILAMPASTERVAVDRRLAAMIMRGQPIREALCPLPVSGVPGWWEGNERPDFYDDLTVFRP